MMGLVADDPDSRKTHGPPTKTTRSAWTAAAKARVLIGCRSRPGSTRESQRPSTQMANNEIMVNMQHYEHELSQIEVSNTDELKPGRLLSAKEMTRHRGGLGTIGWQVDHVCPQLSFDLSERRRRDNDATIQSRCSNGTRTYDQPSRLSAN